MPIRKSWRRAAVGLLLLMASTAQAVGTSVRPVRESADAMHLELEFEFPAPIRAEVTVDGVAFTSLELPGLRPEGSPGAPQRFVETQLLGVPPGGGATVRVLSADVEDLGTLRLVPRPFAFAEPGPGLDGKPGGGPEMLREERRFDASAYQADGRREEIVHLGAPGMLRHQSVQPLELRPLQYDPVSGRTRLVRRVTIAVDFERGAGSNTADLLTPHVATSSAWERIYGLAVVNPRGAAAWRAARPRAVLTGKALTSGLLRPGLLGEDEWKVRVRDTGVTRVTAAALQAAGFPQGTPVSQLRLVLKRFNAAQPLEPSILEIPIEVVDTGADGTFDGADRLLFYAESPRDDNTSEDTLARGSQENVYWLSIATSGTPARMARRAPRAGAQPGPATFPQHLTYEKDLAVNRFVYGNNNDPGDTEEMYFWQGLSRPARVPVAIPGRAPGAGVEVRVETQEDGENRPFQLYARAAGRDSVFLASQPGTNPPTFRAPTRLVTFGTIPDAGLSSGDLQVILWPFSSAGATPFLDNVQVDYEAQYVATGNAVRCTSGGASGETAFAITGFNDPALRAFDITDPKAPAGFDLTGAYAAGTLTLTDSVGAVARTYAVVADAAIPAAAAVELDARDDVLAELASAPAGTYDVLVVANDTFASDAVLLQWKAFREAQGHRLRIVRTSDAYDAFRGGLHHYEAIHRLCKVAFQNWGIETVVLVGDGSEDPAHIESTSGQDFVPSRVRYFWVAGSSDGVGQYRNDLNDKWYAMVSGGPGDPNDMFDRYPDLLLGRFPVADRDELRAVLQKTMQYETPQTGDNGEWRKRVFMFSDDEWVKRNVPGVSPVAHRRGCVEPSFEIGAGVRRASEIVERAFPGDLRVVPFYLRLFSDKLGANNDPRVPFVPEHAAVDTNDVSIVCRQGDGQAHGTGGAETAFYVGQQPGQVGQAIVDSIGAGCLFLALQSHANRNVIADEFVMTSILDVPFSPQFQNFGKPFVFFGFGCHSNEFGPTGENGGGFPGDSFGEKLVLAESRGAVASYASTGFEFLQTNNFFHQFMWHVIFDKRWGVGIGGRAVDSDSVAARWRLSELLEIAEIGFGDSDIVARYCMLGDPLLQLDAGVPRVTVDEVTNGFQQANGRLVIQDPSQPFGLKLTLRDEQGIDSLWVQQRFANNSTVPIPGATITPNMDLAPEIRAKRSYTVQFSLTIDVCNFDIVVGARDLAGRVTEYVGHLGFDNRLLANGIPIQSGDRVDPRTAFQFEIAACSPIPAPLPLEVFLDGAALPPEQVTLRPDVNSVNWTAEFLPTLASGPHELRFVYAGAEIARFDVAVGGAFGMSEVLAFPNPLRKTNDVMRIFFHLGEPIAGGHLRVLDLNGRTVIRADLASPGVVKSDLAVPPGSIGSGVGQDSTHWNYVELFRDGLDGHGDEVANGVYLYELEIRGQNGQTQRRRDRLVIMR